jgi:hypothetical protein
MERLDEFSKLLAESVSRRESLRSIGVVLAGAALSTLGLNTAWAARPDRCTAFCRSCPTKKKRNQCLAACRACNGNTSRLCGSCGAYTCCPTGTACCSGTCTNLNNDFDHCGGCGAPCNDPGPYEQGACVGGACVYGCVAGATACNGTCTSLYLDPANCGACGNVCPASTPVCIQGTCGACQPWETLCGGVCVDLNWDNGNCGACGIVCPNGSGCSAGGCEGAG